MPMRIETPKHLLHVFATFGVGGPQVRSCEVFNHLGAQYRHTILAMDGNYEAKTRLANDLTVDFLNLTITKDSMFRNFRQFRKTLTQIRPDLLVTYNWGAIEWVVANAVFSICPQIHLEEGFRPDEIQGQKVSRILFRRLFLRGTFRVIVPSLNLKEIARQIWQLPPTKVVYIPNGVNCQLFTRDDAAAETTGKVIIGTVAGLRKEKNLARLIRVFARLPNDGSLALWILGDGPEYEALTKLRDDLGVSDSVTFFGHVADPSKLFKQFSMFAISSDTEQMPTSVLEAMASGLPVVGTDVGDIKQMVAAPNQALIVAKTDEGAFLQALQQLIRHPELRHALGRENRQRCVADFSREVVFENYSKLFESAIMSKRKK
jgi:L-malate glycosyltransferase